MRSRAPAAGRFAMPLVLLAACGVGAIPDWKSDPRPRPNAKRVDHMQQVNHTQTWQRSPYFRIGDKLDLPIYLIVAEDHTACIVPVNDWTLADPGDFYPCSREWRIPRPP